MPVVSSSYNPPLIFKNGHLSTIYSGIFRQVKNVSQKRERIMLSDGDFLDLDWSYSTKKTKKVVLLIHGLEGNAQRAYVTGSATLFNNHHYDVCAINLRGCSGEINRVYRSYHSGATEDLKATIQHILETKNYSSIYIKGFSLGGNLTLKYLGENTNIPKEIKGAVAISVPCDLHNSLQQLLKSKNIPYAIRFKKHLIGKLKEKQKLFPDKVLDKDIKTIRTLLDFDNFYTSKAHGFKNALDYYAKSSCLQFLPNINKSVLLINAQNDSFLGKSCYPIEIAKNHDYLHLETPKYGGHVGFYGKKNITYTEKRAVNFLNEVF
ncbi:alpha/beta fold hydrolase [uncultured Maribacter sp.]|uniref:YheT family hydrolase n=1 Tax=uncultured Maribacter sp. TaxID=431308 RepID=UPI00262466FD|nr:alpha/beta fold hydrolase [uncultured Maribacter sp.]